MQATVGVTNENAYGGDPDGDVELQVQAPPGVFQALAADGSSATTTQVMLDWDYHGTGSFLLTPIKIGLVTVTVVASSEGIFGPEVQKCTQRIRVIPPGVRKEYTLGATLEMPQGTPTDAVVFQANVPTAGFVEDSKASAPAPACLCTCANLLLVLVQTRARPDTASLITAPESAPLSRVPPKVTERQKRTDMPRHAATACCVCLRSVFQAVRICVTGSLMIATLQGVGKLIKMPSVLSFTMLTPCSRARVCSSPTRSTVPSVLTSCRVVQSLNRSGCGEQNMINFAPLISAVTYLKAADLLTPEFAAKARKFMLAGYNRELTYMHTKDLGGGGFSAFGDRDKEGSLWLTAYVLRTYARSAPELSGEGVPDSSTMLKIINWMFKMWQPDGSFKPRGRVLHREIQGGSPKATEIITAYTALALLDARDVDPNFVSGGAYAFTADHKAKLAATMAWLEKRWGCQLGTTSLCDPGQSSTLDKASIYGGVLATYVLSRHGSSTAAAARTTIVALLTYTEGTGSHWDISFEKPRYGRSASIDVETAGYGLLALLEGGDQGGSANQIAAWLIAKRSGKGGWHGSQATVVGLEALAVFAVSATPPGETAVTVTGPRPNGTAWSHVFNVTEENRLDEQCVDYPATVRCTPPAEVTLVEMGCVCRLGAFCGHGF